jgi:hypothetical protein
MLLGEAVFGVKNEGDGGRVWRPSIISRTRRGKLRIEEAGESPTKPYGLVYIRYVSKYR